MTKMKCYFRKFYFIFYTINKMLFYSNHRHLQFKNVVDEKDDFTLLFELTLGWMVSSRFCPVQIRFSLISHDVLQPLLMLPKTDTHTMKIHFSCNKQQNTRSINQPN